MTNTKERGEAPLCSLGLLETWSWLFLWLHSCNSVRKGSGKGWHRYSSGYDPVNSCLPGTLCGVYVSSCQTTNNWSLRKLCSKKLPARCIQKHSFENPNTPSHWGSCLWDSARSAKRVLNTSAPLQILLCLLNSFTTREQPWQKGGIVDIREWGLFKMERPTNVPIAKLGKSTASPSMLLALL